VTSRSRQRQKKTGQLEGLARFAELPRTAQALEVYERAARNFNVASIQSEADLKRALWELAALGKAVAEAAQAELDVPPEALAHIQRPPDWLRTITKAWGKRQ
jgi:hypothetical protein